MMYSYDYLLDRGVSRLCHSTKLKDLIHIISSDNGIASTNAIRSDIKDQKDLARYDGELEYICCSVEYPNCWYLRNVRQRDKDQVFKDWVTIFINPEILNYRKTKFSPCNAAKDCGIHIFDGDKKISSLYAPSINGRNRTATMLKCCPTDDQAEILIKDTIPYEFFIGIATCDETDAEQVYAMLRTYGKSQLPIYIAPDIFNTDCSNKIRRGIKPVEKELTTKKEELV